MERNNVMMTVWATSKFTLEIVQIFWEGFFFYFVQGQYQTLNGIIKARSPLYLICNIRIFQVLNKYTVFQKPRHLEPSYRDHIWISHVSERVSSSEGRVVDRKERIPDLTRHFRHVHRVCVWLQGLGGSVNPETLLHSSLPCPFHRADPCLPGCRRDERWSVPSVDDDDDDRLTAAALLSILFLIRSTGMSF